MSIECYDADCPKHGIYGSCDGHEGCDPSECSECSSLHGPFCHEDQCMYEEGCPRCKVCGKPYGFAYHLRTGHRVCIDCYDWSRLIDNPKTHKRLEVSHEKTDSRQMDSKG